MLPVLVPWFQLRRRILTDRLTVTFPIRIRSCCGHGGQFAGSGALVPAPVRILTDQLTVTFRSGSGAAAAMAAGLPGLVPWFLLR